MKNLLITLTALMLVMGCKKERVLYLSDDIKKKYSYKPGSYWIYKDSATGREDSCYVYSNDILFVDYTKNSDIPSEYDKVEYISVRMDLATMIKGRKGPIDIEFRFFNSGLIGLFGNPNDPLSFGCPLNISQQFYDRYYYKESLEFLPSIYMQGNEFLNTYKIIARSGLYYFNNSVGLIKINIINDSVTYNWELVRYNVIK